MITVGFLVVGGARRPAHREPGDAERRDVRKIVHCVVQEGDAATEDTAYNFREDESKCSDHSPAEHAGTQRRMSVACVGVIVPVVIMLMRRSRALRMSMTVIVHRCHFTELESAVHRSSRAYYAV